jgi:pimeloyl-ACP methyl ester carboxylesterase
MTLKISKQAGTAAAAASATAVALAIVAFGHGNVAKAASRHTVASAIRCQAPRHQPITVVLVHGAWADPSSWAGEVSQLQADGCAVHAVDNPVQNLTTDSQDVANFVSSINGPVLLVGHSYGGSVITNAAAEAHNVVGLVYIDAYAPAVGETAAQLSGSTSAVATHPASDLFDELPGAQAGTHELLLQQHVFLNNFANDLPRAQALELWASQTEASTAALETPSLHAAWKTLPSWYFISTGDQIVTPQAELMQAHRAHSQVTIFHAGSHLTLISHPAAVTAVIGKAISTLLAEGK